MKTIFLVGLEGTVSDHVMHKTSIQFLEGKERKKGKSFMGEKGDFIFIGFLGESRKGLLLVLLLSSCP